MPYCADIGFERWVLDHKGFVFRAWSLVLLLHLLRPPCLLCAGMARSSTGDLDSNNVEISLSRKVDIYIALCRSSVVILCWERRSFYCHIIFNWQIFVGSCKIVPSHLSCLFSFLYQHFVEFASCLSCCECGSGAVSRMRLPLQESALSSYASAGACGLMNWDCVKQKQVNNDILLKLSSA